MVATEIWPRFCPITPYLGGSEDTVGYMLGLLTRAYPHYVAINKGYKMMPRNSLASIFLVEIWPRFRVQVLLTCDESERIVRELAQPLARNNRHYVAINKGYQSVS